jgi:hypothetical protein
MENIKEYENELEGFSIINKELALKTILFTMLFYIVNTPLIINLFSKYVPHSIELLLVQSIIFGLFYYIISLNL